MPQRFKKGLRDKDKGEVWAIGQNRKVWEKSPAKEREETRYTKKDKGFVLFHQKAPFGKITAGTVFRIITRSL